METNTTVTTDIHIQPHVFGPEYPKIQTIFKRDMENGGVIMPGHYSTPEFEYLSDKRWRWTEKVDGTNVRLHFNGESITAGGRTDDAQMPGHLMYALAAYNDPVLWRKVFNEKEDLQRAATGLSPLGESVDVTIFGEGYGPKIQKGGGLYSDDVKFIVFDIKVGRWWLKDRDVEDIASKLGMVTVPIVGDDSLNNAVKLIQNNELRSSWQMRGVKIEGIVGKPVVPLFDRTGHRIIAKIKTKDFEALAKRAQRQFLLQGSRAEGPANTAWIPGGGVQTFE